MLLLRYHTFHRNLLNISFRRISLCQRKGRIKGNFEFFKGNAIHLQLFRHVDYRNKTCSFTWEDGDNDNHKFVFCHYITVFRWSENDNNFGDDRAFFDIQYLFWRQLKWQKIPLDRETSISIQMFTQETVNVKPWARKIKFFWDLRIRGGTTCHSGAAGVYDIQVWLKFNYQVSRQVLDYQPNTQQEIQRTCHHGGNANLEYCGNCFMFDIEIIGVERNLFRRINRNISLVIIRRY